MASHLTIQSSAAGHIPQAFAGQQAAHRDATSEPDDIVGLFGAMLASAKPATTAVAAGDTAAKASTELDLAALLLGLESDSGEDDAGNAEALGAVEMPVAMVTPVDPKPLLDVIEVLGALEASLHRGEPLDPDLMAQLNGALDGLAEALGLDLTALPVPDDFAALMLRVDGQASGLASTLTRLVSPLAPSLAGMDATTSAGLDQTAVDAQVKALSDKLGALLAALEDGVPADKLAGIGMPPDGEPAGDIEAALARFASPKVDVPETPELAAPALKLTEPALTGKPSEIVEPSKPDTPAAKPAEASTPSPSRSDANADGGDRHTRDRPEPQRQDRPAAPVQGVATTDANAPVAANAPGQDAGQVRLDATAPRAVQAGYQTSQQQLNLPQIAFELARQVQDGNTRFQIRLDPPELGRIDVRLDIDKSGQVHARLMVEKSETLDLMQRDQRGLERALQQAGIDAGKTNLEFSLKQNPFAGEARTGERHDRDGSADAQAGGTSPAEDSDQAMPTVNLYRGALQASGVNIIA